MFQVDLVSEIALLVIYCCKSIDFNSKINNTKILLTVLDKSRLPNQYYNLKD